MTCCNGCPIGSMWVRGLLVLGLAAMLTGGWALAGAPRDDKKPEAPREKEQEKAKHDRAAEVKGDPWLLETCPVSGEKLDSRGGAVTLNHEGREVRFCSNDCVSKFKAEPAKFLAKADEQLIKQQLPFYPLTECVVMEGDKLEGEGFTHGQGKSGDDHDGPVNMIYKNRLVRFCCEGCVPEFTKNPAQYLAKIDKAIIDKQLAGYPLETCPVAGGKLGGMGEPHNVVLGTRLVRLCCKGCVKELNKNPTTYLAKLDAPAKPKP